MVKQASGQDEMAGFGKKVYDCHNIHEGLGDEEIGNEIHPKGATRVSKGVILTSPQEAVSFEMVKGFLSFICLS